MKRVVHTKLKDIIICGNKTNIKLILPLKYDIRYSSNYYYYYYFVGKICKRGFESHQAVNKHKRATHPEALSKSKIQHMQSTISGDLVRRNG